MLFIFLSRDQFLNIYSIHWNLYNLIISIREISSDRKQKNIIPIGSFETKRFAQVQERWNDKKKESEIKTSVKSELFFSYNFLLFDWNAF